MTENRYEALYRQLIADEDLKKGTYYERLVAVVAKVLREEDVVIHDIRLVGKDTEVKHQIDTTIESGGKKQRLLLECKDFHERKQQNKVGLSVVRDFYGVCDDVKPDSAAVISCTGFTRDAIKYALGKKFDDASKQIHLALVREFQEEDWSDRIREIHITLHVRVPHPKVSLLVDHTRMTPEVQSSVDALKGKRGCTPSECTISSADFSEPVTLQTILTGHNLSQPFNSDFAEGVHDLPADSIMSFQGHSLPITGVAWEIESEGFQQQVVVGGQRVARMIVSVVKGQENDDDRVIWKDELEKWQIDPDSGEVIERTNDPTKA